MPRVDSDIKLDFKDVLVRPKRSTLKSRSDVSNIPLDGLDTINFDISNLAGRLDKAFHFQEFQAVL